MCIRDRNETLFVVALQTYKGSFRDVESIANDSTFSFHISACGEPKRFFF